MFGIFGSDPVSQIDPAKLAERLDRQDPLVVLDVREPHEVAAGHLPGALCIPMGQVAQRAHELPADRDIVVVCRSGNRSAFVCRQLAEQKLTALNLRGGMLAWRGPVERP